MGHITSINLPLQVQSLFKENTMAHFAEIGLNNVVLRVIVVNNDDCKDELGNESESVGVEFCRNLLGGTWVQTSYHGNIRKNYVVLVMFMMHKGMRLFRKNHLHHGF
jgi:hypothetical protein